MATGKNTYKTICKTTVVLIIVVTSEFTLVSIVVKWHYGLAKIEKPIV